MTTADNILESVMRQIVAEAPPETEQVEIYKRLAKKLARILADISDNYDERLEECNMCGKMAIPHGDPGPIEDTLE